MNRDVAWVLAEIAHAGQVDKGGKPYTWHLGRVAGNFSHNSLFEQVAILHDTLEDTELEWYHLEKCGFVPEVVEAVRILSRNNTSETYAQYIERISNSEGMAGELARTVKLFDLLDHLNPESGRINLSLQERYEKALETLKNKRSNETTTHP